MEKNKTVSGLKKQLAAAIAMVLVAAISLGTSTYAWFVSNTKVSATSSSVKATSATPNLLIVEGATATGTAKNTDGKTAIEITSTNATALYPASTNDCKTWWAVSSWENVTGSSLANGYYKPTITPTANGTNVIDGQYTQGSEKLNAYQVSTYSVYTTTGKVDLNLAPTDPIKVEATARSTTGGFNDALRVGIVVDGTLQLVYAPADNEGGNKGNDKDARTGWRSVASATATDQAAYKDNVIAGDSVTGTKFQATNNNTTNPDGTYKKAANKLGEVDTDGVVVQVYVWLEGTDSDCTVGKADEAADNNSYKVTLNLVGATVNPAP